MIQTHLLEAAMVLTTNDDVELTRRGRAVPVRLPLPHPVSGRPLAHNTHARWMGLHACQHVKPLIVAGCTDIRIHALLGWNSKHGWWAVRTMRCNECYVAWDARNLGRASRAGLPVPRENLEKTV